MWHGKLIHGQGEITVTVKRQNLTVKEAEYFNKFIENDLTKIQRLQYRLLQELFSRILKRSYKHNTTFICRRLEELELSWSAVAYLLRVLRKANKNARFHGKDVSVITTNLEKLFQNLLLMQLNYCLIRCGSVEYGPIR